MAAGKKFHNNNQFASALSMEIIKALVHDAVREALDEAGVRKVLEECRPANTQRALRKVLDEAVAQNTVFVARKTLSTSDVAKMYEVDRRTVCAWITTGGLPAHRPVEGGDYILYLDEVKAWWAEKAIKPGAHVSKAIQRMKGPKS